MLAQYLLSQRPNVGLYVVTLSRERFSEISLKRSDYSKVKASKGRYALAVPHRAAVNERLAKREQKNEYEYLKGGAVCISRQGSAGVAINAVLANAVFSRSLAGEVRSGHSEEQG